MWRTDVAVVGAGPAGMAAALAAAEAGADVTLIDEYLRAGGQFFKRAGDAFALQPAQRSREHDTGEELRRALGQERIRLWTGALVWGAFPGGTLAVYRDGRSEILQFKALVIATGAHDRPVAFPGWTLPGVMSAGGAQTLAKTQWVKPGQRMLLAGAGPFLLPVAQQLIRCGVEIVAILEATRPAEWLRHVPALWGQWPRFAEAYDYWRSLRAARVPTLYGHKIVRALGKDGVEAAVIARVDHGWRAIAGTERSLQVDAIAIGYGFLPNLELAMCCDCALRWDACARAWFVATDRKLATSCPNIFAAGEVTGIAGSAMAIQEGTLAGIGAAEVVGAISAEEALGRRRAPLRRRKHLAALADMLSALFAPRAGLWEGLDGATTICRCEEVTAQDLRGAIRAGCASIKAVKDWTRAGMGLCQGRMCRGMVAQLIAEETDLTPADIAFPHIRPPIKPVPIAALARSEVSDTEAVAP
jgi:D-hydroxyproline dehydrogenase subunit alpha